MHLAGKYELIAAEVSERIDLELTVGIVGANVLDEIIGRIGHLRLHGVAARQRTRARQRRGARQKARRVIAVAPGMFLPTVSLSIR